MKRGGAESLNPTFVNHVMSQRFRLFKRGNGRFYSEDVLTGRQSSLRTKDRQEALLLLAAKNRAFTDSMLNRQLAKIYLQASDVELIHRSWNDIIDYFIQGRRDSRKWKSIQQSEPFSVFRHTLLFETQPLHFWRVLKHPKATASTHRWLKQLRNYAWDLGWLLQPVLSRKAWPKIHSKKRRGITQAQHQRIVAVEPDSERRLYYQMLWLTGGAQVDVANFHEDGIDESTQTFRYQRKKMRNRGRGYCFFPMEDAFIIP